MGVHAAGTAAGWGQGLPGGPQLPPHHATTVTAPPGVQAAPPPPPPPAQMMAYPMQQFQVTITLSIPPVRIARERAPFVWCSFANVEKCFTLFTYLCILSLLRAKAISSVPVLACKCCTWKLDSISKEYRRHVCRQKKKKKSARGAYIYTYPYIVGDLGKPRKLDTVYHSRTRAIENSARFADATCERARVRNNFAQMK